MKLDPKTKFHLFRQNKNFCSAPWNLLYVYTNGEIKICTLTDNNPQGNINDSSIEEILKNSKRIDVKSKMLADQPVKSCHYCHGLENCGNNVDQYHHLRNMYNQQFVNQDVNYTDVSEFSLGAVDLHWSSICDLKCVTCWAEQSSSIAVEQGLPARHVKTEKALQLIDYIVKNQSSLTEVYLSGGEPTLIKYNLNLLKQLDKRDDLLVRVNTNMMWDQDNAIIQEILKFPKVMFTCSADNTGTKFEYIRRGAKWNKFVDNLTFLKSFPQVDIRINSVFFVLSALDLVNTIDYFSTEHGIKNFTINQCGMGHSYLRPQNLSDDNKKIVRSQIEQAKIKYAENLNLVGSFNNCLDKLATDKTESYLDYFANIDKLANTNFESVFPELI